jgi:ribonuclease Z
LEFVLRTILVSGDTKLPFELEFIVCKGDVAEVIISNPFFEVQSVPLKHRIPCTGFILAEKGPELKLNVEQCQFYEVPVPMYESIKLGEDYTQPSGKVVPNSLLTYPGKKNKSYAYISDTIYDENVANYVKNVDLLYHESTFLHELESRAKETFHSTAFQAAHLARMAGAQKLLIGHFSARYQTVDALLEEARSIFPDVEAATEGKTYTV